MAGRINDIQPDFFRFFILGIRRRPVGGCSGGSDGDAAFPLLFHPFHHRIALVDLADLVAQAGIKKHPFGGSSLAGVNVGNDTDISNLGERIIGRHKKLFATACGRQRRPRIGGAREMGKGAIGFRHFVNRFFLFHRLAFVLTGGD